MPKVPYQPKYIQAIWKLYLCMNGFETDQLDVKLYPKEWNWKYFANICMNRLPQFQKEDEHKENSSS